MSKYTHSLSHTHTHTEQHMLFGYNAVRTMHWNTTQTPANLLIHKDINICIYIYMYICLYIYVYMHIPVYIYI